MIFSYLLNMQSHPSWVCGLKQCLVCLFGCRYDVTPFVGVWIETNLKYQGAKVLRVTPFVGVWIETSTNGWKQTAKSVTPFVGVWIETCMWCADRLRLPVTPFVGVWIETQRLQNFCRSLPSHPSWVCGLKQKNGRHFGI